MPKKSTAARSGAPRNKQRTQKGFELVRPTSSEKQELEANTSVERATATASTPPAVTATTTTPVATVETSDVQKEQERQESTASVTSTSSSTVSKGSAAARLAARRQTAQKAPQRSSALITPEHYAYVRRDLIFIAILATIMFSVIIILHFVPGIGS